MQNVENFIPVIIFIKIFSYKITILIKRKNRGEDKMAFNYSPNQNQQNFYNSNGAQQPQIQQQNIQPLFPQPQGNVYNINSTLEVANVPVGAGISVALCLNEGFMYIKTMQNGNPLFWAYKIEPYDASKPTTQTQNEENEKPKENLLEQFEQYDKRFLNLEQKVSEIQNSLKKNKGEWAV